MTIQDLKRTRMRNKTAYGMIHRTLGWFVQYKTDEGYFGEMPVAIWEVV